MEKKNKRKIIWKIIKKKVTPQYLLLLIVLLVSNSFAWFIYATQVSGDISVRVKAWKVNFTNSGNPINEIVNINVPNAFPGMNIFQQEIAIVNESDLAANVKYTILSANIMGEQYKTVEGKKESGEALIGTELTSAELALKLNSEYPFKININLSKEQLEEGTGTGNFNIKMIWPYESGNDELDTIWGIKAYEFRKLNTTEPSIRLVVKISVEQSG